RKEPRGRASGPRPAAALRQPRERTAQSGGQVQVVLPRLSRRHLRDGVAASVPSHLVRKASLRNRVQPGKRRRSRLVHSRRGVREHLLRQLLGAIMVTGATANEAIDVTVVAPKRPLRDLVHALFL